MTDLTSKRVLITRPKAQAAPLIEKLASLGAVPVVCATIEIAPPQETAQFDQAIQHLSAYAWVIFTSVNGVAAFWQRLGALGKTSTALGPVRVAAIGPATAQALNERGVQPNFVPQEYVAEAILAGLGDVQGQRILLPRADIARKALVEELEKRGALPDEIAVYQTRPAALDAATLAELEKGIDIATFTSSSTVRNFFELLGDRASGVLRGALIACIGPITAETARAKGLAVDIVAPVYTVDGLVDALRHYDA
jgi:uroporphyrinogen III methyltransferase/synthase